MKVGLLDTLRQLFCDPSIDYDKETPLQQVGSKEAADLLLMMGFKLEEGALERGMADTLDAWSADTESAW